VKHIVEDNIALHSLFDDHRDAFPDRLQKSNTTHSAARFWDEYLFVTDWD
jgi:hypothetical protein